MVWNGLDQFGVGFESLDWVLDAWGIGLNYFDESLIRLKLKDRRGLQERGLDCLFDCYCDKENIVRSEFAAVAIMSFYSLMDMRVLI